MNRPLKHISFLENIVTFVAVSLVLAFALTACDGSEDISDAERLVANWDASSLQVAITAGLNVNLLTASLPGVPAVDATTMEYSASNTFRLQIISPDSTLADLAGNYTVDEGSKTISHTNAEIASALVMNYEFVTADQLKLNFAGADLVTLGLDIPGIDESTLGDVNGTFDRQ